MTKRNLTIALTATLRRAPSVYSVTVGLLVAGAVVASILEPPTAYLVPLIVAAWTVAYWTIRRETTPRYKRDQ